MPHGGYGMMGGYGWGGKKMQQFMDDTKDLRRQIHMKMFDLMETGRDPEASRDEIKELGKELRDLKKKLWDQRKKLWSEGSEK
jgi:hypothetical protein